MRWLLLLALPLPSATFYKDVLPVLQRRCLSCHRPGEIGPMALETYAEARPWAKAIREAVIRKKMPPWFAVQASVRLSNDVHLRAEEIAVIDQWVRQGAPSGNPRDAPRPVSWPPRKPDVTLTPAQAIHVPAKGTLDYQVVELPLGWTEDRWVQAAEIRPGHRAAVHHVVAYIRERGTVWVKGRPTKSDMLAVYTPGQPGMECPPGMAKRIPAGADLVLEIHYTPFGRAVDDRTSVEITFAREVPEKRVLTIQLATADFVIPAGEPNHRVTVQGTIPKDCLLLSLFPHMHLRGKAFEYAIVQPGGRVEVLLRVAPFHFLWQLNYRLAEPRLLKQGTRLRATAWYDNSANNPNNPNPAVDVGYGFQSDEEMMVGFLDLAVPAEMDKASFFPH